MNMGRCLGAGGYIKETCRKTVTWSSIRTNREERRCVFVSGRSKRGGD